MKTPVDHILRPDLPWRVATRAECGLDAADVKQIITRAEYQARVREYGKTRTAMLTCMTCCSTAAQWGTWADDPVEAIRREVYGYRVDPGFGDELRAIELLIAAHRREFDETLAGLSQVDSLEDARRARRSRSFLGSRPNGGSWA